MIREESDEIIGMLIDLWPSAGWNETRRDAWRAALKKHSRDHAVKVVGEHADRSKWPITIAEFKSLCARASAAAATGGAARSASETPCARYRRIYRVPPHAADRDVLLWYYRSLNEGAVLTYRKGYSIVADGLRSQFRTDWRASGLPEDGLGAAESEVFGPRETGQ